MKQGRAILVSMVAFAIVALATISGVAEKPQVFTVLYNQSAEAPFQQDWLILREYEALRGVKLDVLVADDENYTPAVETAIESGQAPDIILKVWPEEIEGYAAAGLLLPFSDYLEFMPYFQAYIEQHDLAGEVDRLRAADGKLYILPGFQRGTQVQQWIYRKDLFESHDLGVPGTYDELYEDLVLLHGLFPDSDPLTACWGGAHLFAIMGAGYGIPAGWNGTRYYDEDVDAWKYAPATDAYREMLRYLHRCYASGVLDPDIYDQSFEEYVAKLEDGRAFATVTWISSGFDNWNQALEANGVSGGEWAPLPVPESTIGLRALPAVQRFRKGLVVPSRVAAEPYLEQLLRFLDWAVYSKQGMDLTTWGVGGVTYRQTQLGRVLLPNIIGPKTPDGETDMTAEYGFATLFDLNEDPEFEDYRMPDDIVLFLEQSREADETLPPVPRLELSQTSQVAIDTIKKSLDEFSAAVSERFVTGELNLDDAWSDYVQDLEDRGYKTLEAIWNSAWATQAQ